MSPSSWWSNYYTSKKNEWDWDIRELNSQLTFKMSPVQVYLSVEVLWKFLHFVVQILDLISESLHVRINSLPVLFLLFISLSDSEVESQFLWFAISSSPAYLHLRLTFQWLNDYFIFSSSTDLISYCPIQILNLWEKKLDNEDNNVIP